MAGCASIHPSIHVCWRKAKSAATRASPTIHTNPGAAHAEASSFQQGSHGRTTDFVFVMETWKRGPSQPCFNGLRRHCDRRAVEDCR